MEGRSSQARSIGRGTPAAGGGLRNGVEGACESRGKVEVLACPANAAAYLPGTSVRGTKPGQAIGPPRRVVVERLTKPVGTRDAHLTRLGADRTPVVCPVFKYRRLVQ
jgi:hypothetical protein